MVQRGGRVSTKLGFEPWRSSGDARADITLRQFEMRSGRSSLKCAPLEDATETLYGSSSFSQFAMNKEITPPGVIGNIPAVQAPLARLLHDRVGGDLQALGLGLMRSYLHPWTYQRHSSRPILWRFGWLSYMPRLKIGQSLAPFLSDGTVDGIRLVPEEWLTTMAMPVSNAPQGNTAFIRGSMLAVQPTPRIDFFHLCRARSSSFEGTMTSL